MPPNRRCKIASDWHLYQLLPSSSNDADQAGILLDFVMSANLAAQEAGGDTATSTTASAVREHLLGSSSERHALIALFDRPAKDHGETGEYGLPTLPLSYELHDDTTALAFLEVALPLRDDLHAMSLDITLDAALQPLPEDESPTDPRARHAINTLLSAAGTMAARHGRSLLRCWTSGGSTPHRLLKLQADVLQERGFRVVFDELHGFCEVPGPGITAPQLPDDITVVSWQEHRIPEEFMGQVGELYEAADTDTPHGEANLQPKPWTAERLEQRQRTHHQRGNQAFTLALVHVPSGALVAVSEAVLRASGHPSVAECSLTVVGRPWRGRGMGALVKQHLLAALPQAMPSVRRLYSDVAAGNAAMLAINAASGWQQVSNHRAWECEL